MDLPTYTSIWRIEKRLYKLYDFRLPMPLPIGQVTVFAAITVPYVVLLSVGGVPFNHTLIWLYVLPPGAATWLATRPVLESKRLPELIRSQVRYLAEPRIWCRMAPLAERDVVVITGRIWRLPRASRPPAAQDEPTAPPPWLPGSQAEPRAAPRLGRQVGAQVGPQPGSRGGRPAGQPLGRPVKARGYGVAKPTRPGRSGRPVAGRARAARSPGPAAMTGPGGWPVHTAPTEQPGWPAEPAPAEPVRSTRQARTGDVPPPRRTAVTVVRAGSAAPPPAVETALAGPSARRGDVRAGLVSVVPGGHRPGAPDQLQRDRARAQLPLDGPRRVVVLGCTVGAGQTVTTLLTGEILASLRSDQVAVLDLNPGVASLGQRAMARPAPSQAVSLGPSRLAVLGPPPTASAGETPEPDEYGGYDDLGPGLDQISAARAFEAAATGHQLVLADPSTSSVSRLLATADLLILVAPASAAAVSAIGMTFEWLEAHGQAGLAAESIMVLNGVSRRSIAHVEQAERVCAGRCRAIVRVPWDEVLKDRPAKRAVPPAPGTRARPRWAGLLSPGTVGAYTALAGVIVAALAGSAAERGPARPRQVGR